MSTDLWDAPLGTEQLNATVRVPGSKSLMARYLVLAALADSPSTIHGALLARDTLLMMDALRTIGCEVEIAPDESWVKVTPATSSPDRATIECGLAGTVMRFVPPLVSLIPGQWRFDGDDQAYGRPLKALLAGIEQLGVNIDYGEQSLPFELHSTGVVSNNTIEVDASASSQFISAPLLIGHRVPGGLTVRNTASVVPSIAHIDMTIAAMADYGIKAWQVDERTWQVEEARVPGQELVIEPDLSNASVFCAAAAVTGGTVKILDWPAETTQAGDYTRELLTRMGAQVSRDGADMVFQGTGKLTGINADLSACGELTPTMCAVASLADSPSEFTGVGHLRGHETDRITALQTELTKLGAQVEELPDGLRIIPGDMSGTVFESYHDHRMATAGAIIGLRVPGVQVVNIGTTVKTIPDFAGMWQDMLSAHD